LAPLANASEHLIQAKFVPAASEINKYNPYYGLQVVATVACVV